MRGDKDRMEDQAEHIKHLKQTLHRVTLELIPRCRYCQMISPDYERKHPIYCTRFSGPYKPLCISAAICLACGEYRLKDEALVNPKALEFVNKRKHK